MGHFLSYFETLSNNENFTLWTVLLKTSTSALLIDHSLKNWIDVFLINISANDFIRSTSRAIPVTAKDFVIPWQSHETN